MFYVPARFAPVLFGFILSGLMSLIVSGVASWRNTGLSPALADHWLSAWASSWPVAFPVVLLLAPRVRRLVGQLCRLPAA